MPTSFRKVRKDCETFPINLRVSFHFQTWYIDHHSNFSIASASFTLTIAEFLPTGVSSNEPT